MRIKVDEEYFLSPFTWDDTEQLADRINDPEVYANTLVVPHPYTERDARVYISKAMAFFQKHHFHKDWVVRKCEGELIGGIGLQFQHGMDSHRSEIGYWLYEPYRGRGIMPKVIDAFAQYCFETHRLVRLEAMVFARNPASGRALEKAGFVREGHLRCAYFKDGEFLDGILYGRVREE